MIGRRRFASISSSVCGPRKNWGITGPDAEAYSDAFAVATLDPQCSDVLNKVRNDFDAAGVIQSDEQILGVFNELSLQAGSQIPSTRGGAPDALTVALARKLRPK
jgi:hypothetical protein